MLVWGKLYSTLVILYIESRRFIHSMEKGMCPSNAFCMCVLCTCVPHFKLNSSIGIPSNWLQGAKCAMEVNHRLQSTIHCGLHDIIEHVGDIPCA